MSPGISVVLKGLKFDLHFDVKTSGRFVEPLKCIFQLEELQRSLSRLNEVPPQTLAYILAREGFVVTSSMSTEESRILCIRVHAQDINLSHAYSKT
ncbi:hypothetical protein V1478_000268 [Vespula squamosa]|uniref:Uncharacterized protein n=1 Tax=Vespula squamosa TaxID=30214 RepID=A0ABD2C504_VESSQ